MPTMLAALCSLLLGLTQLGGLPSGAAPTGSHNGFQPVDIVGGSPTGH